MEKTDIQLQKMFDEYPHGIHVIPSAMIMDDDGEMGIVLEIRENLSDTWKSGDIIVFWQDGEQTVLPETFDLVKFDLFKQK